jgi:hypothetical protein
MMAPSDPTPASVIKSFIACVGPKLWAARMEDISRKAARSQRVGRALVQKHMIEVTLERMRRHLCAAPANQAERIVLDLARDAVLTDQALPPSGRMRFRAALAAAMENEATLLPIFHLLRTVALQRKRGFEVHFAGFADGASFDLLLHRQGVEAELACDVVSAEEGREVHRGAWVNLVDRIDPDLQIWLSHHPGRYLLKLTLPQGLNADQTRLAALHDRIRLMLQSDQRADHDEAAVLRLDPLMLAAAQADELGLMPSLRREFGHEAHLAVTSRGAGVFVMAARAAREDEVAVALRRRLAAITPTRLTGTRPGILAMFVEDTDRTEWRHLRDRLELESEARQFLTHPQARGVVAVTCASRLELLGGTAPDAAADGELRFRNPAHPAARAAALAPAVLSSL